MKPTTRPKYKTLWQDQMQKASALSLACGKLEGTIADLKHERTTYKMAYGTLGDAYKALEVTNRDLTEEFNRALAEYTRSDRDRRVMEGAQSETVAKLKAVEKRTEFQAVRLAAHRDTIKELERKCTGLQAVIDDCRWASFEEDQKPVWKIALERLHDWWWKGKSL